MNVRNLVERLPKGSDGIHTLRALYPDEFRIYDAEEWFQKEILDKVVKKVDEEKYPNSVFYFIDDKCFFEFFYQDEKNTEFWVRYKDCWKVFYDKFNFNYTETQQFIKTMVEEHFKMRSTTPNQLKNRSHLVVEEQFKMRSTTPFPHLVIPFYVVEEHFKMRCTTPLLSRNHVPWR